MDKAECKEIRTTLRSVRQGLLFALNQSTDKEITRMLSNSAFDLDRIIGKVNMTERQIEAGMYSE